ncbi:MAG: hypothetical protein DCC71_25505 [Proteobacteria bacterium]|nr:MAG: hypothetical protein DCC71_25505 [Pseudomonadota bacterium]
MTNRPDDDAFVRRVRDAYAPPPLSAAQRTRFDAALEERIARERWRFAPWAAAALAGGAAALLVLSRLGPLATPPEVADETTPEEEYVLALAGGADEFEAALPVEYRAIAGMIDGE